MIITEAPSNSVVQSARADKDCAGGVVSVSVTVVVVEVEGTGVSTIIVVPAAQNPRVVRVHKVGVHFTVYNLFHQHDETKNNLPPFSFKKENGRFQKLNHLFIFLSKKMKRKSTKVKHYFSFLSILLCQFFELGQFGRKKSPN